MGASLSYRSALSRCLQKRNAARLASQRIRSAAPLRGPSPRLPRCPWRRAPRRRPLLHVQCRGPDARSELRGDAPPCEELALLRVGERVMRGRLI